MAGVPARGRPSTLSAAATLKVIKEELALKGVGMIEAAIAGTEQELL
ncbi:MAG TPA: hypothetical protein PKN80_00125 [bacterium]|uniref:Uncharacterized protein n=1 Tax=candidate division TA06 bacterium ADurb.Bin417 TaxID=1852828 RepID=A0A1V5MKV6_UNCT6|nr:MAG: hypothetical protein BWY73_00051 [candidate division TA06 bacterium ADurb.Bin417]HNQ34460.1 hypothetical protein [bacterium]HNS48131.1 hypothetical protein [bacterium]